MFDVISIVALWRSMEGEPGTLVGLYTGSYDEAREKALDALILDLKKWSLPVSYRFTLEHLQ